MFDTFAVVDWSAANDTGSRPRKDAIWAGVVRAGIEDDPVYLRNRVVAARWLADLIDGERAAGRRLMIGLDFPFGYPAGFARVLTGGDDPLTVWAWMSQQLEDTPDRNNRFDLAAQINRLFPGIGPFWFNGTGRDIPDLPRKGKQRTRAHGLAERRLVETRAPRTFPCWQMGGAGAVGGQVMTGMATLWPLKARYGEAVAIWPFDSRDAPVVFAEVWPSLIGPEVDAAIAAQSAPIKDAVQVRLLARALSRLTANELAAAMTAPPEAEQEGWILGVGQVDALRRAARPDIEPPRFDNDCFALPPGVDWLPVDAALARLKATLAPLAGTRRVSVTEAVGGILAADVIARRANPPLPNAAVDGYGFAHASTGAGQNVLPLLPGRAAAGERFAGRLPDGAALRILTGAALPDGVDTVVLEEDTTEKDGFVAFDGPVKPGANTRKAGEDIGVGDRVLSAGHVLRPPDLALLSVAGVDSVSLRQPLRVGVLSTGDELVEAGARPGRAGIFDANRPMLLSMIDRWGHSSVDLGIASDDRDGLRRLLDEASERCDAILTSGGASAGDEDHMSAILNAEGHVAAWRIALKPGRPLLLGAWSNTPLFGLPGNPVAVLVCALIFVRPALSRLAGGAWTEPLAMTVPAAFEKSKKPGRREFLRARLTADGAAEVFASEGSGRVSGLSWATGLVELPDGPQHVRTGDPVRFLPYAGFGL